MKYENILNRTWEYLENNYKGSEITIELWLRHIEKLCDNDYCLKKCIKLLWSQWEYFDYEQRNYDIKYIKDNYGVIVK